MSVIGFDFGYQTCYIAVARQGGIETIANEYSDRCTPSFVSLGEKNRSFGASAKTQINSNIKNTIWGWKKFIGRKFSDPTVQREKGLLPYEVVEGPDGSTGIQVFYQCEQQTFSAEQVTAMIFTKLRETAGIALKTKVVDCVIAVPNYYTDTERRCMLDAAAMAGLNVLRLMNDTTATALAYGIYKQDLPAPEEKPRNVIFLDMGHNDIQLAACAFNKGKLKVLATTADQNLGGRSFDNLIANYFTEDFKKRYKVDAHTKPRAYMRLLQESEKLKKLMSANATDIPLNIECFMDDKDVSGRMNREKLEELGASVLAGVEQQMRTILDYSKLKNDDIYSVEIVGGATRMPAIKSIVKAVFGKDGSTTLNSDEAVARGCALQCAILSPTFRVRDFSITDVQPYPIKLHWQGGMDEEGNEMEVFNQFHGVPFSKMLTFYRREAFSVEARYPDADVPYPGAAIGSFKVDKVVPQVSGESSKVKVKVRVNIHGICNVSSASMVEKIENADEEPMEVDNGPAEGEEKSADAPADGSKAEKMEEDAPSGTEPAQEGSTKESAAENSEDKMQTESAPSEKEASQAETSQADTSQKDTENKENSEASETKNVKGDKKEQPDKKKKKTVKTIDLPVQAFVPQLSQTQLNLLFEKEGQMVAADKLEKERADAKNTVEEYVYEMRDKLFNEYEPFIKEDDRDSFSLKLEDVENWLYEDGEDQRKQVYVDKITELKKFGQPVVDRHREFQARPAAFEELGAALQLVRKAADLCKAKDEKYAHLEAADVDKLCKTVKEKQDWFDKNMNASNRQKSYENPTVLTSQIKQTKESLLTTCNPILNKPKPKAPEPPKEEKKEDKKEKGEGDGTAKPEEGKEPAAAAGETAAESDKPNPDMELD